MLITTNLDAFGIGTGPRDVGFVNKYVIDIEEGGDGCPIVSAEFGCFDITFTTNFQVLSHSFNANDKTLHFDIIVGHNQGNVAEIIIPRDLFDGELTILLDGVELEDISDLAMFWAQVNKTDKSSVVSIEFPGTPGTSSTIDITATKYLGVELKKSNGGGCLIATAAFGSELAPQVQQLRELRDNTVLQTEAGTLFMTGFNHFYYSFSPAVADYERENPAFKEAVKLTLTPLLISLTLLQYADIDSESSMLGYGIGIILLNIGMYFVVPAVLIMKITKRVNIEKLHQIHA